MQLVTNEKLATSRFRLGTVLHMVALAVLIAGLFVSLQVTPTTTNPVLLFAPYLAIIVFFVPYFFGKQLVQRYGPKHRQDAALAQAIKGLDNRYTLITFAAPNLPDYLLVSPNGVTVLLPRPHTGTLICRGQSWDQQDVSPIVKFYNTVWGVPLGNPTRDLESAKEQVIRELRARLGDAADSVPVQGVVVFTSPQARLRLEGCAVQAASTKSLKNLLRSKGGLSSALVTRVREALIPETIP